MKIKLLFILLSLLIMIEGFFLNKIFDIDNLIINSLLNNSTQKEIEKYLEFRDKWFYVSYALVPFLILIKTTLISSFLYIGCFFSFKKALKFKDILYFSLKAECVFLLPPIFKIIWFYFFKTDYTIEDLQNFYPLSALNIVGYKGLEPWYIYPFQVINLFELSYWLFLAYFIGKATQTNMDKGLKIVACSYGPTLLLWVVVIMFVTLNFS
jgi:hypothetical protein